MNITKRSKIIKEKITMMLSKRTREHNIPCQPTIPPMPEVRKPKTREQTQKEFINEVISLATEYGLNCYVYTDGMWATIDCQYDVINKMKKSETKVGNVENDIDDIESFEPERAEYIKGMKNYLEKLKEDI
jgi:hypothetical protein